MIIENNANKTPIMIVADMNGKILHIQEDFTLSPLSLKVGDNVNTILDIDSLVRSSSENNRFELVTPIIDKYKMALVKLHTEGVVNYVEIHLFESYDVSELEMLNDKSLISTYSEVVSTRDVMTIKLSNLLAGLVEEVKRDIRFAYRKIKINTFSDREIEAETSISRLCTLIIGSIAVLNEIEFKNTIELGVDKRNGQSYLKISVLTNALEDVNGVQEMERKYPGIMVRLEYIKHLCENDEIDFNINPSPTQLCIELGLPNGGREDVLSFTPLAQNYLDSIRIALDMFIYDIINL